jgi:hypothetical protein
MKKIAYLLFVLLSYSYSYLQAEEHSVTNKLLKLSLGYLTGQATHELGHYVVAWSVGVEIYPVWDFKNIPPLSHGLKLTSRENCPVIGMGGFFAEYIASETILAFSSLKTDDGEFDYFLCGWLLQTIICPIGYSLIEETNPNFRGDIWWGGYLESRGSNKGIRSNIETFLVGHAIITAARMIFKLNDSGRLQLTSTPTSIAVQIAF